VTKVPTIKDYPLAETCPETVVGARGKTLDELTLDRVISGEVDIQDLRITPDALLRQAEIAAKAGRDCLGKNFSRGAEMAKLPQEIIMEIYELLRPGRATDPSALTNWADKLRDQYDAPKLAMFLEEAAEVYQKRGLFRFRF